MAAVTGTGGLTSSHATIAGTASHGIPGTGALVSSPATLLAGVNRNWIAVGALVSPSSSILAETSVPDPTIWDTDNQPWGEADFVYSQAKPVMIIGNEFYQADAALRFGETSLRVVMSRTGLTIFGKDRFGNWKSDPSSYKEVTGLWPIIRGTAGTIIKVYVGAQDSTEDPIRWEGPYDYICGQTTFMDFTVAGRFLGIRFESQDQEPWELLSYDMEIELTGGRG